ncbi:MAG TPA: SDR family oxidoreductase [Labilithrix sp.]|jgi:NAD(P)-dependent dehydrogenase (short-subunit alcohol dehydrogenase family)
MATTWLVTGANRGIGLELCRQLAARKEDVIAACRTPSRELDELGVKVVSGVDVSSDEAGDVLLRATEGKTLGVLLHNAGIMIPTSLETLDFADIRREMEVNAFGPLRLTKALLPRLAKGSKIAFVSSRVGSIADNGSGGMYGYRMSKCALNMAAVSIARDLAPKGISVVILHPGFIKTDMTGGSGNDEPPVAAKGLLARIDALGPETSGHFYHANGQELPW